MAAAPNLLDDLEAAAGEVARPGGARVEVVRRDGGPDLKLIVAGDALRVDAVSALATVRSCDRYGGHLGVRVADEWCSRLGAELEAGNSNALDSSDLVAGRSFIVYFCDANATKALHVGHVRNIAVGNALSGCAEQGGAKVVRRSLISDAGRSMAEAIAGYLESGGGATPSSLGIKGDRFVGTLYRRYVENPERLRLASEQTGSQPSMRELAVFGERLLESDHGDRAERLCGQLEELGLIRRLGDGSLVYGPADAEGPLLVLRAANGMTTQNLRYLAAVHTALRQSGGSELIEVVGDEWTHLMGLTPEIMRALGLQPSQIMTTCVPHGMVTLNAAVVKSSGGQPPLVDDLLEVVAADTRVERICANCDRVTARQLAPLILLGYFLARPTAATVDFSLDALFQRRANPGLAMAEAWTLAHSGDHDGAPAPAPGDPAYRRLLLGSQLHRRYLRVALRRLDPSPLARHYAHLSHAFLAERPSGPRARLMRTMLEPGLDALGLRPGGSGEGDQRPSKYLIRTAPG